MIGLMVLPATLLAARLAVAETAKVVIGIDVEGEPRGGNPSGGGARSPCARGRMAVEGRSR